MPDTAVKPVCWIGSSYRDFRAFPDFVQDEMGFALYQAQIGEKHRNAKPLKGFGGAGVLGPVDLSHYIGNQTITNASASMLAKFRASLSYLVAMARKCLIRANMFSTRCRYL